MSEVKDIAQHPNVEIAVKNFGPIAEANIDLRPLTVFVGPSNTGKTYFATLVYALHDVFEGFSGLGLLAPVGFGVLSEIMSDLRDRVSTDSTLSEENIQDFLKKLRTPKRPFKLSDLPETMRSQWLAIIKNSEVLGDELHETLLTKLKNCFDLNSVLALRNLTVEGRSDMTISLKVNDGNQGSWSVRLRASESDITLGRSVDEDIILLPQGGSIYTEALGLNFTLERRWGSRSRHYLPAARSGIMQSHRVIANSLVKRTTRGAIERYPETPTLSSAIADFMEKLSSTKKTKHQMTK